MQFSYKYSHFSYIYNLDLHSAFVLSELGALGEVREYESKDIHTLYILMHRKICCAIP